MVSSWTPGSTGVPSRRSRRGWRIGRYGCSDGYEGTRVDRVLLDLDPQPGDNRLVSRVATGGEPSFYFSTTPMSCRRSGKQYVRDFPAADNPSARPGARRLVRYRAAGLQHKGLNSRSSSSTARFPHAALTVRPFVRQLEQLKLRPSPMTMPRGLILPASSLPRWPRSEGTHSTAFRRRVTRSLGQALPARGGTPPAVGGLERRVTAAAAGRLDPVEDQVRRTAGRTAAPAARIAG